MLAHALGSLSLVAYCNDTVRTLTSYPMEATQLSRNNQAQPLHTGHLSVELAIRLAQPRSIPGIDGTLLLGN